MRKPGIKGLFITKLNYCLLFHFYLLFFVLLSSYYIPAILLTYKRCRLVITSNILNKVKFNEIASMSQFYLIFYSTDCYSMS